MKESSVLSSSVVNRVLLRTSRGRTPRGRLLRGRCSKSSMVLAALFCAIGFALLSSTGTQAARRGIDSRVNLTLVELSSDSAQGSPFRMDTYDAPHCGFNTLQRHLVSVGDRLLGIHPTSTGYQFDRKVNERCKVLCGVTYRQQDVDYFFNLIHYDYTYVWELSGVKNVLHALMQWKEGKKDIKEVGTPVGYRVRLPDTNDTFVYHLNNHFDFTVFYRTVPETEEVEVVALEVIPLSLDRTVDLEQHGCYTETFPLVLDDSLTTTKVFWTYSIEWKEEPVENKWTAPIPKHTRWADIKQALILTTILLSLLWILHGQTVFGYHVYRTGVHPMSLHQKTILSNLEASRKIPQRSLLASLVSTGMQLYCTIFIVLVLRYFSFVTTSGEMLTAAIFSWCLLGSLCGFMLSTFGTEFHIQTANRIHYLSISLPVILLLLFTAIGILYQRHSNIHLLSFGTYLLLCTIIALSAFIAKIFSFETITDRRLQRLGETDDASHRRRSSLLHIDALNVIVVVAFIAFVSFTTHSETKLLLDSMWSFRLNDAFADAGSVFIHFLLVTLLIPSGCLLILHRSIETVAWEWQVYGLGFSTSAAFFISSLTYFQSNFSLEDEGAASLFMLVTLLISSLVGFSFGSISYWFSFYFVSYLRSKRMIL